MSSKKGGGKRNAGKAGEASAGRPSASEGTAAKSTPAAKKKPSLPAFGFAADLLKGRQAPAAGSPAAGSPEKRPPAKSARETPKASEGEASVPSAAVEAAEKAAAQVSNTDPERVFAFADSLSAGQVEEQAKKVRRETWVTLSLASETFALPVSPVREILRISSITRVPHAPYPIRGVTNLRGRVIPVLDLRIRLELPEGELTRMSRIIVVSSRGRLLGLLVDAVHQVLHLDVDRIQPPPEDVMTVQSDYISGVYHVEQGLILLLDVDRALVIRDAPVAPAALLGDAAAAPPSEGTAP